MSKSKPQKEVPEELMTHYIVKDYQRMFLNHDTLLEKIEELRRQLILKQREIDTLNAEIAISAETSINSKKKHYLELIKGLEEKNRSLKILCANQSVQILQLKEQIKCLNNDHSNS